MHPHFKRIPPEHAPKFRRLLAGMMAFAEHAAPEVFKWIGWTAAIAAIWVVAEKIDSTALLLAGWLLFALVLARIQWAINGRMEIKEDEDGSIPMPKTFGRAYLGGVVAWGILIALALVVARGIVEAELFLGAEAPPAPALDGERTTPDDPRAERSGQGTEGEEIVAP